ncbi:glycosyltransferase family 4 protein [Pseudoduganella albidiflava]|uniref:Glycosyltransferase n=1 Tax=Pseudoduganella albidiflava TaxID=321983 RepID=A0A411WUJ2_9BURK|nr:glycosyltransferase [Pseudoduganella albidiflava]QBI00167.1 glycosyltransferase [Pseudoduganella albidiflava]GGY66341.1 hypothetical protein GCM10007387_55760 [Pseudoduganella albidiflava]
MTANSRLAREREIIRHLNRVVLERVAGNAGRSSLAAYFQPIDALSQGLPVPIYGAMLLVWQIRDRDLQALYPLDTLANRIDFLSWCACHGLKEYALLKECTPFRDALDKPAFPPGKLPELDAGNALSWLMVLTALRRTDLKVDIARPADRARLLVWYLEHGFASAAIEPRVAAWQTEFLLRVLPSGMTAHQAILHQARQDLQQEFPLPSKAADYQEWYARSAEYRRLAPASAAPPEENPKAGEPFGVNVIGHLSGVSGIAEDSRMALASLARTTIPAAPVDYVDGAPAAGGPEHRYAVNLFCFPALEHARYVAERGGNGIAGRYNIACWPWEISHWPEQWHHLFALADEIWAPSRYIQEAIKPASPVPVLHMPMAVETPPASRLGRRDFALPENAFLFYFSYDLRSASLRKNPEACIEAFLAAFPGGTEVGLVIKALRPESDGAAWQRLQDTARRDGRIHLIDRTLDRGDLAALYSACDCFISLHRAEGFGRNIAEAMSLGKPVITTGYSGNRDFTDAANSVLVACTPREIQEGDYPYVTGGTWVDPDIQDAAAAMRRVAGDAALATGLQAAGRRTMLRHSTFQVARTYMDRLKHIRKNLPKPDRRDDDNELV